MVALICICTLNIAMDLIGLIINPFYQGCGAGGDAAMRPAGDRCVREAVGAPALQHGYG